MPHSQEKTPEQLSDLPNPDLNPLLNPTLGRHLGRWAQVYFTSPPEKREEAVGELLRELQGHPVAEETEPQNRNRGVHNSELAPREPETVGPAPKIRRIEDLVLGRPTIRCGHCGHESTDPQRFCGMCGAPFSQEHETSRSTQPLETLRMPDSAPAEPSSVAASGVREPEHLTNEEFSDVRWLREKNLAGDAPSSWRRTPRYAPAIVAILAIGILIYAQSRPKTQSPPTDRTNAVHTSPANSTENTAAETIPESASSTTQARTDLPPVVNAPASPTASQAASNPYTPAPAGNILGGQQSLPAASSSAANAFAPAPATNMPNPANGSAELAQAEELLSGRKQPRDSAEAVKYLWRAVGKENPSAILLLSDLYLVGDGVPRSCDQARLLLMAAARKGVPQAADKLRDLLRSGCPK